MDAGTINEISRETVYVLLAISTPILALSLGVGIMISLFQALTQIQEATLTFVPKIIVVYLSMLVLAPYMFKKLEVFTDHIIQHFI
jgi:flagellar biosynthetic protein FliQ